MPSKVIVRDFGYARILKELNRTDGVFVTVGVHGEAGSRQVQIATFHELGTPGGLIPQRSFIRSTVDGRRKDIAEVQTKSLDKIVDGKATAEDAAGIVGLWVENAIKKKITSGDPAWPPLKDATIARKGSSRPLIDTGQLRASITHVVTKGEKPKGQI